MARGLWRVFPDLGAGLLSDLRGPHGDVPSKLRPALAGSAQGLQGVVVSWGFVPGTPG